MRPLASAGVLAQLQQAGRRSYATSRPSLIANRARWTPRPVSHQIALRQSIRRQSTDTINPEVKAKAKKGGFRMLRWAWRLTYISAIAGVAYGSYGIWEMRNPHDQPPPDPSKKTLVVLGAYPAYQHRHCAHN
jgi:NADH:ubiquinone reductase (non-electrogenic)